MTEQAVENLSVIGVEGANMRFRLQRSARRTLEISVGVDGEVEVRAPQGVPLSRIEQRLRARRNWIQRRQRERERSRPDLAPRTYQAGETHRYLGRQYRLALSVGDCPEVRLVSGRLKVAVRDPGNPTLVEKALEDWYYVRAKAVLLIRLQRLLARAVLHGLAPSNVRIQRMRRRWGSCSLSGRIVLNTDLIRLPVSLIDYVIIHELCHIRVPRHDARFERLLSRALPEWRDRADRLARSRLD